MKASCRDRAAQAERVNEFEARVPAESWSRELSYLEFEDLALAIERALPVVRQLDADGLHPTVIIDAGWGGRMVAVTGMVDGARRTLCLVLGDDPSDFVVDP